MKNKFIVFDRDGTLIKHIPYVYKVKDIKLFDDTIKSIELLKKNDFKFFLHTNQSGISRKYFTMDDVVKCNNKLIDLIGLGNDLFEDICIAEDYPPKKNSYRKPSPRFGLEIIKKYKINKNDLFYIGDSISDLQTGNNIGCYSYGVNTGLIDLKSNCLNIDQYNISNNLYDTVKKIIKK
tara:strand:+ start:676 stop:1212 length:537 start_codon:yes stop_codon:yes gene_type:complete